MKDDAKGPIAPRMPATAPPKGFRKHIGLEVKLRALLLHGPVFGPDNERITELEAIQWDHCPPIMQREYDTSLGDTLPPANDPAYIIPKAVPDHHKKTNEVDKPAIAKTKRLSDKQLLFRAQVLAKTYPETELPASGPGPKRKIASRPFPTRKRENQSEN